MGALSLGVGQVVFGIAQVLFGFRNTTACLTRCHCGIRRLLQLTQRRPRTACCSLPLGDETLGSAPRDPSTSEASARGTERDALNYVTTRGAGSLNDYARNASPFDKIGVRPITVEIIYIVRASGDSFEIRWKEQTYENGGILKTDRFTAVANVLFSRPNTTETISKNPLGLYIDTFNCWRDSAGADAK